MNELPVAVVGVLSVNLCDPARWMAEPKNAESKEGVIKAADCNP